MYMYMFMFVVYVVMLLCCYVVVYVVMLFMFMYVYNLSFTTIPVMHTIFVVISSGAKMNIHLISGLRALKMENYIGLSFNAYI